MLSTIHYWTLLLAEGADPEHVAGHRPHLGLGVLAARPAAHPRPVMVMIICITSVHFQSIRKHDKVTYLVGGDKFLMFWHDLVTRWFSRCCPCMAGVARAGSRAACTRVSPPCSGVFITSLASTGDSEDSQLELETKATRLGPFPGSWLSHLRHY